MAGTHTEDRIREIISQPDDRRKPQRVDENPSEERKLNCTTLDISVVWDQVRAAFHVSSGAGVKIVDAALQLLADAKPARVLMAQVRQPFSY